MRRSEEGGQVCAHGRRARRGRDPSYVTVDGNKLDLPRALERKDVTDALTGAMQGRLYLDGRMREELVRGAPTSTTREKRFVHKDGSVIWTRRTASMAIWMVSVAWLGVRSTLMLRTLPSPLTSISRTGMASRGSIFGRPPLTTLSSAGLWVMIRPGTRSRTYSMSAGGTWSGC